MANLEAQLKEQAMAHGLTTYHPAAETTGEFSGSDAALGCEVPSGINREMFARREIEAEVTYKLVYTLWSR